LGLILMAASFPFFVEAIGALQGNLEDLLTAGLKSLSAR
jgi:hypothetical protein